MFFFKNNIIPVSQYGFQKMKNVETQLIESTDDWSMALERRNCVDIIYFDLKNAFDKINHKRLIEKLLFWGTGKSFADY